MFWLKKACVFCCLLGLFVVLGTATGHAQQSKFSFNYQDYAGRRYGVFDFSWQAPAGQQGGRARDQQGERLTFALPETELERGKAEFTLFSNEEADKFAFEAVKREAEKLSKDDVQITVTRMPGGYKITQTKHKLSLPRDKQSSARDLDENGPVMQALNKAQKDALAKYVSDKFYMMIDDVHIMPDHKKIALRYARALGPMADAVRLQTPGLGFREQVDWMLGFFQSIPYDQLLNRYNSKGAGFETPYGLLASNSGDCDTKSVALAALLRNMYPTLRITMVYVPEHAFVGIAMPKGPDDYALKLGGEVFVLADPTGPRFMKLGEVNPRALKNLNSGAYSFQEIQ